MLAAQRLFTFGPAAADAEAAGGAGNVAVGGFAPFKAACVARGEAAVNKPWIDMICWWTMIEFNKYEYEAIFWTLINALINIRILVANNGWYTMVNYNAQWTNNQYDSTNTVNKWLAHG